MNESNFEEVVGENIPPQLQAVWEQLKSNQEPRSVSVRNFLEWFGVQRRGYYVVQTIREALDELEVQTEPDFESPHIDAHITFRLFSNVGNAEDGVNDDAVYQVESSSEMPLHHAIIGGAISDPTYQISRLEAANRPPVSVTSNDSLRKAITVMLSNDYSQLPVMNGSRSVKGMISWASIGARLALGCTPTTVQECTDSHREISSTTSLLQAINIVAQYEYVLVRNTHNDISGIITASDLSLQLRQLAQPFLLIGEIENHIRKMIDGKFTAIELEDIRDPADTNRKIEKVSDLTFGEYIQLLQKAERWQKINLNIEKNIFVENLDEVRRIRNEVMHFDPDGLPDAKLSTLENFARFLNSLQELNSSPCA